MRLLLTLSLLLLSAPLWSQIQVGVLGTSSASSGAVASKLARQFNGTSDYLQSASNLDFSATGANTKVISIWFRLYWNSFANNDALCMEYSTNYNPNTGSFICDPNDAGGMFNFNWQGSSGAVTMGFTRPTAAAWHSYLIVIDNRNVGNAGTSTIYVDGATATGLTIVGTNASGTVFGTYVLYFMSRAASSLFGAGRMSDIHIWKADESANIATLNSCSTDPHSVDTANLVYGWPIRQVSPETPDAGAVNLTVNGTSNVASACP